MEEIIELFEPKKYVHMGHDEVYQIGVCPVCSKKDPAKLFYDDVMRLYNYLKGKNLGMMIWADMLQEASGYKTVPAVKELPKDIVLLDFIWYFHTDKDIEENLIKYGYNVIFGNMYSSHFPRYESRIRKDRIMGGEVSAWVRTDDHTLNREGKIYDILYTANMLWSEDYDENCRFAYDEIIRKMIPDIRNVLSGAPVYTQGKEFKLNEEINVAADKVTFFHYTDTFLSRIPWEENVILGEYTVKYTDGTSETVKVVNSENVGYWGMRAYKPLENGYYRHNGYASPWYSDAVYDSGKTVYRFTWDNPHKNKSIERITFAQYEDAEVNVVIEKIEV
jgi:hexosaminidase